MNKESNKITAVPEKSREEADESIVDKIKSRKLLPMNDKVYHGAFADFGSNENNITREKIEKFEKITGKEIAWAYFSDNWFNGIEFPKENVLLLDEMGIVPFIRLMPRSRFQNSGNDPIYTLEKIIDGTFDEKLRDWAKNAKETDIPLLIEFGTEMNGDWFVWSGIWNGGETKNKFGDPEEPDGPEKFKKAYRHIIELFREEESNNITWFFHVNITSYPKTSWNKPLMYYPGDNYIDWIGLSLYGAQYKEDEWALMSQILEREFFNIKEITTKKPIAILEFGVVERKGEKKDEWIKDALETIIENRYPEIKGVSYWHSKWENSDGSTSNMKIDSSKTSASQYMELIKNPVFTADVSFSE